MVKPKWDLDETIRAGVRAYELVERYLAELEPRLEPGLVAGLVADVGVLRDSVAGVGRARAAQYEATGNQDEALARGNAIAMAIRGAVRLAYPRDAAAQRAFGVGLRVNPTKVTSVSQALAQIVDAAEKDPERSRRAGVLPADIERVRAAYVALNGADDRQETKKTSSQSATRARDAAHLLVERRSTRSSARRSWPSSIDPRWPSSFDRSSRPGGDASEPRCRRCSAFRCCGALSRRDRKLFRRPGRAIVHTWRGSVTAGARRSARRRARDLPGPGDRRITVAAAMRRYTVATRWPAARVSLSPTQE